MVVGRSAFNLFPFLSCHFRLTARGRQVKVMGKNSVQQWLLWIWTLCDARQLTLFVENLYLMWIEIYTYTDFVYFA